MPPFLLTGDSMTEEMQEEYERHKREKINPLERAGDFFGGIDERIDFLAPKIFQALTSSNEVAQEVGRLKDAVAQIAPGVEIVPKEIQQIPFSYTVPALQGVRLMEHAPFAGYIKSVTIHWPDGCKCLVDVRVGHGVKQFCPSIDGTYLALNDATPTYYFNEWVEDYEEIWVEIHNGDAVNPHAITVTLSIEEGA